MGLSQHVLTMIEKTGAFSRQRVDSSDTEEQCRQRCEYSIQNHVNMQIYDAYVHVYDNKQ